MKHSIGLAVVVAVIALAACGGSEKTPGGVTQEESEQLNNAAEMLDASPDSLVAPDETGLGNGEDNGGDADAETGDLPVSNEVAANAR